MHQLIDTHAHLDEIDDTEAVLAEAAAVGVTGIVAVGEDHASNIRVLELAAKYPGVVFPALGLHPWNIKPNKIDETLKFVEEHAENAVAIGEIGLDYHKRVRQVADKDIQKEVFFSLLEIAVLHGKPASIHSRYAWKDAVNLVVSSGLKQPVFHWFTGPSSVLSEIIQRGYYLSATPAVAYHEEHRRAIRDCPINQLLLETDTPVTYGFGRGFEFTASPKDIMKVLSSLTEILSLSAETIAEATSANAKTLFNIQNK
ncbi:TatD family hydrolase [Chloroflexota bacterium]